MKFTGLLKEKIENAQTKEEKKKILEEVGIEMTDEEMDFVVGGSTPIKGRRDKAGEWRYSDFK